MEPSRKRSEPLVPPSTLQAISAQLRAAPTKSEKSSRFKLVSSAVTLSASAKVARWPSHPLRGEATVPSHLKREFGPHTTARYMTFQMNPFHVQIALVFGGVNLETYTPRKQQLAAKLESQKPSFPIAALVSSPRKCWFATLKWDPSNETDIDIDISFYWRLVSKTYHPWSGAGKLPKNTPEKKPSLEVTVSWRPPPKKKLQTIIVVMPYQLKGELLRCLRVKQINPIHHCEWRRRLVRPVVTRDIRWHPPFQVLSARIFT